MSEEKDLNRRVLEAQGWRIYRRDQQWYAYSPDGEYYGSFHPDCPNESEAWKRLSDSRRLDYEHDLNAAIRLADSITFPYSLEIIHYGQGVHTVKLRRAISGKKMLILREYTEPLPAAICLCWLDWDAEQKAVRS